MKKLKYLTILFYFINHFISSAITYASTTNSITQWGITWHFDRNYEHGTFANGDYWVLGPVTITRITPDFDGSNNGWEVNPIVDGGQGFQDLCSGGSFNASLIPDLPYKSPNTGIVSIVKTTPSGIVRPCIKTAAVLTIVTSIPPGNGAHVFRPPYVGSNKPYYYLNELRVNLLPSNKPVGSPPSLESIEKGFLKLRLDHKKGVLGRSLRPQESMNDYQPKNGPLVTESALRFMLDDSISAKMPALIQYLQAGIDKIHTILEGQTWPDGGGHQPGHAMHAAFTAILVNNQNAISFLKNATFFHATRFIGTKNHYGNYLWGDERSTETAYWSYIRGLGGSRSHQDPYKFIDGGECGASYQIITSQAHKGETLAAHLMPIITNAWNSKDYEIASTYSERWVNHGVWAQPDPCAPYQANSTYGVDYGPDPQKPGMCILDKNLSYYTNPLNFACKSGLLCGRYSSRHGDDKDGGQYRSQFVADMWNEYKQNTYPLPVVLQSPVNLVIKH